ncbi:hypothetical protein EHS25_001894 [Saitozyma podzolica]|uniref:Uncharacterized protein n=1 Tax=Saitozyma podzolica TaxID=1890683 RepID=A0A427YFN7_9TREE|nr:hypothetical protein EHS25_001894 [Saitozyma podzolica]
MKLRVGGLLQLEEQISQDNFQIALLQAAGGEATASMTDDLQGKMAACEKTPREPRRNSTPNW